MIAMRTIVSAVLLFCTFGTPAGGVAQDGASTTPDRIDSLLDREQWALADSERFDGRTTE